MKVSLITRCPLRIFYLIFLFALLPCFSLQLKADGKIKYISDVLLINLKTSVDKPYKIVTKMRSDDRVEILETSGKFSRIKTDDNKEGWIANQYLTDNIPKSQRIKLLEDQIQTLKSGDIFSGDELIDLDSYKQMRQANRELTTRTDELLNEISQLKKDITILHSRDSEAISTTNELMSGEINENNLKLQAENENLKNQNDDLLSMNANLKSSLISSSSKNTSSAEPALLKQLKVNNRILERQIIKLENERMLYWFIAGAFVFFIGMLTGKLFSSKTRKYRY